MRLIFIYIMKDCYKTASPDRYGLLKEQAKYLRNNQTDSERLLWEYLKASKLGVKFRRQSPLGDYIAGFVCLSKKIVVELDGSIHNTKEQKEHDNLRDYSLEKMGFKTLRFTNNQIYNDIEMVLQTIKQHI